MKKVITILIALVAFTASAPVAADYLPSGSTQRDVVPSGDMLVKFLEGEGFVLSRLELREYSSDPVEDLIVIANSDANSAVVRSRAIQSLALYRSDQRVADTLATMLETTGTNQPLFSTILVSYAQVEGEQGAEKVAEFLDADDDNLRMAAVVALGRFGGQTGFDVLLEQQKEEQDPRVLERINSYTR